MFLLKYLASIAVSLHALPQVSADEVGSAVTVGGVFGLLIICGVAVGVCRFCKWCCCGSQSQNVTVVNSYSNV